MVMASDGAAGISPKLDELNDTKHDRYQLLSLPLELRSQIYVHVFVNIYARRRHRKSSSKNELAVLQTCTQIHGEASSILYNITPLRFMIGHMQKFSSISPPQTTIDRFQNVYFNIIAMSSTHPHYEFEIPFKALTEAFILPSVLRRNCHIQCELEEHTRGYIGRAFHARVKDFTSFRTVRIDFEGKVRKAEFPQETVADDDPAKQWKLYMQGLREGARQREYASLAKVTKMFRVLEVCLGKGQLFDTSGRSEALYARRLVFHPRD